MRGHIRQISMPRQAIEPRNPIEALWFAILDFLGKPRIQSG
ncbi:MAG: hypothetical protein ACLFV4_12900 [Candidatus Hydrogenedentota bacterium]